MYSSPVTFYFYLFLTSLPIHLVLNCIDGETEALGVSDWFKVREPRKRESASQIQGCCRLALPGQAGSKGAPPSTPPESEDQGGTEN